VRERARGDEYERLIYRGTLVMQLHRFDVEHHHARIGDPHRTRAATVSHCGSRSTTSMTRSDEPTRLTPRWYGGRIATRRTVPAARAIARSGCAIETAISSCWRAPTASRPGPIPALHSVGSSRRSRRSMNLPRAQRSAPVSRAAVEGSTSLGRDLDLPARKQQRSARATDRRGAPIAWKGAVRALLLLPTNAGASR
jgi:hypothetical protein